MSDKIIKKINFQAEFESAKEFDNWLKKQEKNLDTSLDNAFNKNIKSYRSKIEAVYQTLREAGDNPSQSVLESVHKTMKELAPLAKQIATQFSKLTLGKELSTELDEIVTKVENIKKALRVAKGNITRWSNKKTEDGQLTDKELERIYKQNLTKKSLTVGDKTYGKDGLGADDFVRDFKANTQAFYDAAKQESEAASYLEQAVQERLDQIDTKIKTYTDEFNTQTQELENARKELEDTTRKANNRGNAEQVTAATEGYKTAIDLGANVSDTDKQSGTAKTIIQTTDAITDFNKENKKTPGIVKKAATQVLTYGTIIGLFKRGLSEAKRTITELDKALTDMAIVTNLTREQAWKMVESLQAIAKETGTTTTAVAATTTKFLQQGKSMTQATQMTKAALMAASIAGIDASRSVDLLTNAMNGFQLSASQAIEVSDKFAALAAASATDYEELAVALSKVAAQANLAGMSMDFTLGMLAKGIEVTREAPETIGTALKTVISRMRELTDYGETLEEGMDVNRVETALKNVGVQLRDTNGQFRNLENVLTELGGKWNTLNVNQQANVAVALAGTRQQSRLIAMMQDFDRTLELVDISTNSYGATMAQQSKYMEGLEAATNNLTTAYEGLVTNMADGEAIVFLVNILSSIVNVVGDIVSNSYILIPILVTLSMHGLTILSQKIAEHNYQKATIKLDRIKLKNQNTERLNAIKIRKEELRAYIQYLKSYDIKEDTLETQLKIAKLEAERNGNTALAVKYEAQIKSLNEDDLQEKITLQEAQSEYNNLIAEENAIHIQNVSLQASQLGILGSLSTSAGSFVTTLFSIGSQFVQMIAMQKTLNKEKKAETRERYKNIAAISAERVANTKNAGASMAGSAGKIPYVGWIIGAIILAAVLGLAIAGISSYMSAAHKKEEDNVASIEGNIKAIQKLQAEMYNLGQTQKVVSDLVDEFDSLASKINQSAEDLSRLAEIIQEFNDAAGFEMIAPGTDATTALTIMRGYKTILSYQMEQLLAETNATFAKAVTDSASLRAYMQNAEGAAVVRQLISQNYKDFSGASSTTQKLIMDLLSQGYFASSNGINYTALKETFSTSDIALLDEAVKSGSLAQYKKALDSLSPAAQKYAKNMKGVFKAVQDFDEVTLAQVDALKLNADQLERFGPILAKILEANPQADLKKLYEQRMGAFVYKNQANIDSAKNTAQAEINKIQNQEEYKTLSDLVEEDKELTSEQQSQWLNFATKIGAYENIIADADEAQKYLNMSATEFFNTIGNTQSLIDLQNEITKTSSHLENLGKLMRGELHGAELDTLLNEKPYIIQYLEDGIFTAQEYVKASQEMQNELSKTLQTNLNKTKDTFELEFQTGWEATYSGQIFNSSIFNTITNTEQLEEAIKNFTLEAQEAVRNAWYQYSANKLKAESGMLSDEAWERLGKSTGSALAQAQINQYQKELERYSKDSTGYQDILNKYIGSIDSGLSIAKTDKQQAKDSINALMGEFLDQYEIINGEIFGKENGVLKAISEIDNITLRNKLLAIPQSLIETYTTADDIIVANAEARADAFIDIQNEQFEKELEIIEKKKEVYEQYFDDIDALEEEQELQQSKDDIIQQLAALSTGVDGTTKSKIKDLQSQLNDLLKEEQQSAKEAARNELLESLDTQTEQLNNSMEELDSSIGILIRAIIGSGVYTELLNQFAYNSSSNLSLTAQLEKFLHDQGVPGFKQGGLVNYTGLAMVHGSTASPEGFLDAMDTELLTSLLEALHIVADFSNDSENLGDINNNNNSVNIENITIKTEHLNNNQDFKTAGTTLAEEFAAVIRERGLNVNVRK